MKNLKIIISWVAACVIGIVLLALISTSVIAQKKSKQLQKPSAKILKCKDNDSDCFIRAANTCKKATLTMNKSLLEKMMNPNVPNPTYTQVSGYEIRGGRNGKCTFYSKVEKSDVTYSEDYIRYVMKDEGKTRQEVELLMSEQREAFQQMAGLDGVCSFQTKKLVAMLNRWWQKDGSVSFSTKDFEGADCQGKLYNFTLPNQTIKRVSFISIRQPVQTVQTQLTSVAHKEFKTRKSDQRIQQKVLFESIPSPNFFRANCTTIFCGCHFNHIQYTDTISPFLG